MEDLTWRDMITDALRYWEPRRLLYNAILVLIVLGCACLGWAGHSEWMVFNNLLFLFVLAVLANVAYCAAYPVDLFLQYSHFRPHRRVWRLVIVVVGFSFAAALSYGFATGLFFYPASF